MSSNLFNTSAFFWLCAGVLIGVAATFSLGNLWRHISQRLGPARGVAIATASTAAVVTIAAFLYLQLGQPDSIATATPPHAGTPSANATQGSTAANSMESVTEKLASRLSREGGNDADWNLLAQSYEFMGRNEDATRARQHLVAPAVPTKDMSAAIAAAQALRVKQNYSEARAQYEKIIAENGMTADSWADYADVLGSQANSKLSGAPAQAIDKALALDPNHPKALWLKASLALEEKRYGDAVTLWKHLRSVIGDDSSDVRIIDANIAEAQQLAGSTPATKQNTPIAATAEVKGTIDIDPKFRDRAMPGSVLFIYAKSESPGPPLAVYRTTVAQWPIQFKLDDSMAMMPGRNLSNASSVLVEARISRSGQATPAAGDLQAPGTRVNPREGKVVHLRINKEVS